MAYPDLSDLITRTRTYLNEAIANFCTDAEITKWLNRGERDIAIKSRCIKSTTATTTTASSRLVSFTGYGVDAVEYVPASGAPIGLFKITPRQYGHTGMASTAPRAWFQWGDSVEIEPTPNAIYNLNLYVSIAPAKEMASSTDEPHIPAGFTHLLPMYAASIGFLKARKLPQFLQLNKMYQNELLHCTATLIPAVPDSLEGVKIPETQANVR